MNGFGVDPKTFELVRALGSLNAPQPAAGASGSWAPQLGAQGSWAPPAPEELVDVSAAIPEQVPQLQPPMGAGGQLDPQRAAGLQEWLNKGRSALRGMSGAVEGIKSALDEKAGVEEKGFRQQAEIQTAANEDSGKLFGAQLAEREKVLTDFQTQRDARAKAIGKVEQDMAALKVAAEHPYAEGSAEQIQKQVAEYDRVIQDPGSTETQRQAAKAAKAKMQEPDPERVFGGSTGRKIMAAIAMGLGAYGAALTKTPNYALQIINDAIERDIAAQRERAAKKKGAYEDSRNLWRDLVAQGTQEEQTFWTMKAFMWNSAADLMDARMKLAQNEQQAAALMAMSEGARANANVAKSNAELEANKTALSGATAIGGLAAEQERNQIAAGAAAAKAQQGTPTSNFLVRTGPSLGEKAENDSLVFADAYIRGQEQIARLKELREKFVKGGFTDLDTWAKIRAAHGKMKSILQAVNNTGQSLTPGEEKILEWQIGKDPTDIGPLMATYKELEKTFAREMKTRLQLRNLDVNEKALPKFKEQKSVQFQTAGGFEQ